MTSIVNISRHQSAAPLVLGALSLLVQCNTNSEPARESAAGVSGGPTAGAGGVGTSAAGGGVARMFAGAGGTAGARAAGGAGGSGNQTGTVGAGGVPGSVSGTGGVAGSAFSAGGLAGSASGGAPAGLTLGSVAVPTNGVFVDANTCTGADTSPDLEWSADPSAPQSYAIMLSDAATGVPQWIVWDIPPTVTSLPAGLDASPLLATPAGAKQVSTKGSGYVGPCPGAQQRFYLFTLFALPVATLPNVTTSSLPTDVATAINLTPPLDLAFFGASAGMGAGGGAGTGSSGAGGTAPSSQ
jgi:Raf kinase inhibitor-like YbhB/YbcL family protein